MTFEDIDRFTHGVPLRAPNPWYNNLLTASHGHMAFIDETYIEPTQYSMGLYMLQAVVISEDNANEARHAIRENSTYREDRQDFFWHTKDISKEETYKIDLMNYISQKYSTETPMSFAIIPQSSEHKKQKTGSQYLDILNNNSIEEARAECIATLTKHLSKNYKNISIIFEGRKNYTESGLKDISWIDRNTVQKLRENNIINPNIRYATISPSNDPLLFLPDTLAWSMRHSILNDIENPGNLKNLTLSIPLIESRTNKAIPHNFVKQNTTSRIGEEGDRPGIDNLSHKTSKSYDLEFTNNPAALSHRLLKIPRGTHPSIMVLGLKRQKLSQEIQHGKDLEIVRGGTPHDLKLVNYFRGKQSKQQPDLTKLIAQQGQQPRQQKPQRRYPDQRSAPRQQQSHQIIKP